MLQNRKIIFDYRVKGYAEEHDEIVLDTKGLYGLVQDKDGCLSYIYLNQLLEPVSQVGSGWLMVYLPVTNITERPQHLCDCIIDWDRLPINLLRIGSYSKHLEEEEMYERFEF